MSDAEALIGTVLEGRYRLDAVIGEGGMGAVFRAQQLAMDRRVAIKLLKSHLTSDDVALRRFAREARGTFKVDSPHAVKVLDYGITEARDYYIVLEYLDGRTVQRELMVDGAFAPTRVVHIARQALHALGAAHRVGLVHRDLKPDNVMLLRQDGDGDYTKLLDFGVAKLMANATMPALSQLALTAAGTVYGTPEFMSPEQACGQALDGRSDLYSLAATMFAMLTGKRMYACERTIEWLTSHATVPAPHLSAVSPHLAAYPELDAILQRCFAKSPAARPPTAEALADQLAAIEPSLDPGRAISTEAVRAEWFGGLTGASQLVSVLPASLTTPTQTVIPTSATSAIAVSGIRGSVLIGFALAIIALIAVSLALVFRSDPPPAARPRPSPLAPRPVAVVPPPDAAIPIPTPIPIPIPTPIPTPTPNPTTTPHPAAPAPHRNNDELLTHLAAAAAAQQSGNRLRELAEADLALRLDPSNARAIAMVGEVQLADGNLEGFCAFMHKHDKVPGVVARMRAAHCP